MEITNKNGMLRSEESIKEEAIDRIVYQLSILNTDVLLRIINSYRECENEPHIFEMSEDSINECFEGVYPWELLKLGIDTDYAYFTYDGEDEVDNTNDIWYGIDPEDVAMAILNNDIPKFYWSDEIDEINDIVSEYVDAMVRLRSISPIKRSICDLVTKYKNGEADQFDLLEMLEKLGNSDIL